MTPEGNPSQTFRQTVKAAIDAQERIKHTFTDVFIALEQTRDVGRNHQLYHDWRGLSQQWASVVAESRTDATLCAEFIGDFQTQLPLLLSQVSLLNSRKRSIIQVFFKQAQSQQEKAEAFVKRIVELQNLISAFPEKVKRAADSTPWERVKRFCGFIWTGIQHFLGDAFEFIAGRLLNFRFQCGSTKITIHHIPSLLFAASNLKQERHGTWSYPPRSVRKIEKDCDSLRHDLGFQVVLWAALKRDLELLHAKYTRVEGVLYFPESVAAMLLPDASFAVLQELVDCLNDYAQGISLQGL